jgi:hypothetical protein
LRLALGAEVKAFYRSRCVIAVMKWSERYVLVSGVDKLHMTGRRRFGVLTSFPDSEERV